MSDPARVLTNSHSRAGTVEWDHAAARNLLTSTRGPVGSYLSRVIGPAVVQAAQQLAPVSKDGSGKHGPGKLRASISKQVDSRADTVFVDVRARAFYGLMVAEGTKPHEIAPKKRRRVLADKQGHVFGPHVHHPGTRPNHFMQEALRILR